MLNNNYSLQKWATVEIGNCFQLILILSHESHVYIRLLILCIAMMNNHWLHAILQKPDALAVRLLFFPIKWWDADHMQELSQCSIALFCMMAKEPLNLLNWLFSSLLFCCKCFITKLQIKLICIANEARKSFFLSQKQHGAGGLNDGNPRRGLFECATAGKIM